MRERGASSNSSYLRAVSNSQGEDALGSRINQPHRSKGGQLSVCL